MLLHRGPFSVWGIPCVSWVLSCIQESGININRESLVHVTLTEGTDYMLLHRCPFSVRGIPCVSWVLCCIQESGISSNQESLIRVTLTAGTDYMLLCRGPFSAWGIPCVSWVLCYIQESGINVTWENLVCVTLTVGQISCPDSGTSCASTGGSPGHTVKGSTCYTGDSGTSSRSHASWCAQGMLRAL